MLWHKQKPTQKGKPRPSPEPEPGLITGGRKSGKTRWLEEVAISKNGRKTALIITPWPKDKRKWQEVMEKHAITRMAVHTPETLVRYALQKWSQTPIEWGIGNEEGKGMSPKEAHSLMREHTKAIVKGGILPEIDMLMLEEMEEWETGAGEWIKEIPHGELFETSKVKTGGQHLEGWVDEFGHLQRWRWIEVELGKEKPGEWMREKIVAFPNARVICQTKKEEWKEYLKTAGCTPEIVCAREAECLPARRAFIPTFAQGWGGTRNAWEWLDIVAARGTETTGLIQEDERWVPWIPKNPKRSRWLGWEVN